MVDRLHCRAPISDVPSTLSGDSALPRDAGSILMIKPHLKGGFDLFGWTLALLTPQRGKERRYRHLQPQSLLMPYFYIYFGIRLRQALSMTKRSPLLLHSFLLFFILLPLSILARTVPVDIDARPTMTAVTNTEP
ncbi:hypothetical protein EJ110_NYTH40407 [Nymphaea thermarum]|nr:hypothetical protein EJ110_NYTH40407 [Nymphaea thermarum]